MFLDNKNILEYAQITQSEPKSIILYIEGRSNIYYSKLASTYTYFEVVQYFLSDILRRRQLCRCEMSHMYREPLSFSFQVFCRKFPRNMYENVLIPLFEKF